jgi:hypothetical protein
MCLQAASPLLRMGLRAITRRVRRLSPSYVHRWNCMIITQPMGYSCRARAGGSRRTWRLGPGGSSTAGGGAVRRAPPVAGCCCAPARRGPAPYRPRVGSADAARQRLSRLTRNASPPPHRVTSLSLFRHRSAHSQRVELTIPCAATRPRWSCTTGCTPPTIATTHGGLVLGPSPGGEPISAVSLRARRGPLKIVQIRYKFFPLVQVPLLAGSHAPWAPHA